MADELRLWIADGLVLLGVLVITLAVYGMLTLPDLFTRLHAAAKAVVLGTVPILLATVATGDGPLISRALLVGLFLLLTTPVSSHAIAHAAYRLGDPSGESDTPEGSSVREGEEEPQPQAR